jgi:hypothetical protein
MKDHEIAKLVNDLRDIAVQFHDFGCLRETIHRRLVPEIEQLQALFDVQQKMNQHLASSNTGLAEEIDKLRNALKRYELAHAIHNDAEHQVVMARIGELMPSDPMPNTPDGEELSLLVALAMAYETERCILTFDMTDEAEKKKALKAIRKAAREGRIVYCEQDRIGAFTQAQVAGFIDTIWGSKALVTDESQISDFVSFSLDPAERAKAKQDCCTRIFEIYGVKCEPEEYIWQVLERIYK